MSEAGDPRPVRVGRPRTVIRTALLERIDRDPHAALVVVRASAGFGKTTVLQQMAQRVGRSAYLRLSDSDNDPAVLVHDLALALGSIEPIAEDLVHRVLSRSLEPGLQAAARLAEAISTFREPTLLLVDDVHVLADPRAGDTLSVFIESLPPGLRVAAGGHHARALHPARMRAADRLIEVNEDDLAFDREETLGLARLMGVPLSDEEVASIVAETRGWPVAISLTLRSIAETDARGTPRPPSVVTRSAVDYIRAELLDPLDADERSWLLRSSVLDTMSGPLCDDALVTTGSASRLRALEHSSLLVQPIEDDGSRRYRYHPLLRRLLRDELDVEDPAEALAVARRAAIWCDAQAQPLDALEYARASEDRELTAGFVVRHVWPLHWSGRIATLERWVAWFDVDGLRERFASVAVVAGFLYAVDGRRHAAELWLAAAENSTDPGPMPDGSAVASWVAMLRGMLVRDGVATAAADARIAEEGMRRDSPFMPGVRLLSAVASLLSGQLDEASEHAREAIELSETRGAWPGFAMASGIAGALALRAGRPRQAREIVHRALERLAAAGLADYVLSCLVHAVAARMAISSSSMADARHHLAHVHRLRPLMTASVPWLSLPVRLEAIEALVALGDIASARTLMREVDDILRARPDMGTLSSDAAATRARLDTMAEGGLGHWTLTAAELRVLQYLPTHLTFGEIAERLYVSPHTVKSQAVAIYSKLGVSSRRAAIEAAVENGLLDASALRFPLGQAVDTGIG